MSLGLAQCLIFAQVNRLVDLSPGPRDLVAHGLQFFAARRWRELGHPVPIELVAAELQHAFVHHASTSVLARVCEACDGPLLLVKGPAATQLYHDPALRPYQDLDLVVADPRRLQEALLGQGFTELGEAPYGLHHERPLLAPEVPLVIEVHGHVKWIRGLEPPPFERLVRDALPFDGADGVLMLPPAEHAALLAVHVWAHDPLTRLLRLIDVAVATSASDTDVVARVVREWGLEKLWRRTTRLIDAVIYDSARLPAPERFWGRKSRPRARDDRVGGVSGRLLGPLVVLPPGIGARAVLEEIVWLIRPESGETARTRVRRISRHLRDSGSPRTVVHVRDTDERSTWKET